MQENTVWRILNIGLIGFCIILAFILPGMIFGHDVPDEYKGRTLFAAWISVIWMVAIGWNIVKTRIRIASFLFWLFISSISAFAWYWENTSEDILISNLVRAEQALQDYPDNLPYDVSEQMKQWYLYKFQNEYAIQKDLWEKVKLEKQYDRIQGNHQINFYLTGILLGIVLAASSYFTRIKKKSIEPDPIDEPNYEYRGFIQR